VKHLLSQALGILLVCSIFLAPVAVGVWQAKHEPMPIQQTSVPKATIQFNRFGALVVSSNDFRVLARINPEDIPGLYH
jgi:hypothetical protein